MAAPPLPKKKTISATSAIGLSLALLVLVILGALVVGPTDVSLFRDAFANTTSGFTLREIRLPRVLGAALMGASLAVAGLASQTALRNPLASPDVLGVSSGAALGAAAALALGGNLLAVSGAALVAGLVVTALVAVLSLRFAATADRDPMLVTILIGMAIASVCAAGLSAVKWLADPLSKLPAITYWLLGSLASFGWRELTVLTLACGISAAALWRVRARLGVLALGDEVAASVGANVASLRWTALLAAALISATSVAMAGLIPWIALLVPHAAQLVLGARGGARPWALSACIGAILLVVVDTLCRASADVELPPGVVLAFVGVPMFVWLIGRARSHP